MVKWSGQMLLSNVAQVYELHLIHVQSLHDDLWDVYPDDALPQGVQR